MNYFMVIGVCVVLVLVSYTEAQPQPPNPKIDKECLTAPSEDVDPMTCCDLPEMLDSKVIDNCAKKVYGSTQAADDQKSESPFAPHIRCLSECIFNETGILKDRVFRAEVALDTARKALGPKQSIWMPVVEAAIKTCNENAMKAKYVDQKACGHLGAFLTACLNTQMFKNCPQSSWIDAKGCSTLREMTIKCPIIAPIPPQD